MFIFQVVTSTCMGVNLNFQGGKNENFANATKRIHEIAFQRMYSILIRFDLIFQFSKLYLEMKENSKVVHDLCDKIIVERRKTLMSPDKSEKVFMDILLEANIDGKPLSNAEIIGEVLTFLSAGNLTTAIAIATALYNIGKHPTVQQKLVEEIACLIPDRLAPVTIEVLNELRYMQKVIQETLRLYPAVPQIARKVLEEFELDGKIVPVGASLLISPYQMGRNPELFHDPEKFIPERFDKDAQQFDKFAYIPFSAGQR